MGYADQALERIREALTLAHKLAHPFSLAFALFQAALLHYHRREGQAAQAQAEAVIALCIEHGFPLWVAGGRILRGWALAEQGEIEEGVTQLRQGLAAWRAVGTEVGRPYWLAMLAEAYGEGGQAAEGLSVLAEALATVDKSGERRWKAELYRLKGAVLLTRSAEKHTEAETCFRQALDIAHQQQAKSLELRAATSLSRLWQQQGKRTEARALLAPIYGWFTEGFDTIDLQEAKALLDALA
jgi:predicted ATPase